MPWGAVAGAVIGGISAGSSARKSDKASRRQMEENRRQFDLVRNDTKRYREVGEDNLNYLNDMLRDPNFDFSKVTDMPGFKFRRQQGQQGVVNMMDAKGMGRSGRAMQELSRYNQDYSSNEFNNYLNQIKGMASYGMGGINASAQAGANMMSGNAGAYNAQRQNAWQTGNAFNDVGQGSIANYLQAKNRRQGGVQTQVMPRGGAGQAASGLGGFI